MAFIDLPLQTGADHGCALVLFNSTSFWGGTDRWIEIELKTELLPKQHTPCAQPLACLQSVMQGRQTAILCQDGMLSLKRDGPSICVDYHGSTGLAISGQVPVGDFERGIEMLANG